MQEPEARKERSFLGKAANPADLVPAVDSAHLKMVWELYLKARLRNPGQQVGIGGLDLLLPAGADSEAVGYRA